MDSTTHRYVTIAESHGTKDKKLEARTSRVQAHLISMDTCAFCSGNHFILHYNNFKVKPLSERKTFVTTEGLCFNCLGFSKNADYRNTNRCRYCKDKHHTLLHDPTWLSNVNTTSTVTSTFASTSVSAPIMQLKFTKGQSLNVNLNCQSTSIQSMLLATTLVKVQDTNGCLYAARAMINHGSQCSFVFEALLEKLKLFCDCHFNWNFFSPNHILSYWTLQSTTLYLPQDSWQRVWSLMRENSEHITWIM